MKKKKPTSNPKQKLSPYLLYKDVGKALDWLAKAFGFVEYGDRFTGTDGTVQHAAMQISQGGEMFMLGCPGPNFKNPKKLGSVTQMMYVYVEQVDKHFARAKKAGAKILSQPEDQFYGDRRYGATDPEGHQWFFAEPVRDVPLEQMHQEMKERG